MAITRRNVLFSSIAAAVGGLMTGRQAEAKTTPGTADDPVGMPAR